MFARIVYGLFLFLHISMSFAKININIATETQLCALKGIGPAKAKAIVEYRQQNGVFKSIQDLKKVKGIGEKIYEDLKDDVSTSEEKMHIQAAKSTEQKIKEARPAIKKDKSFRVTNRK